MSFEHSTRFLLALPFKSSDILRKKNGMIIITLPIGGKFRRQTCALEERLPATSGFRLREEGPLVCSLSLCLWGGCREAQGPPFLSLGRFSACYQWEDPGPPLLPTTGPSLLRMCLCHTPRKWWLPGPESCSHSQGRCPTCHTGLLIRAVHWRLLWWVRIPVVVSPVEREGGRGPRGRRWGGSKVFQVRQSTMKGGEGP